MNCTVMELYRRAKAELAALPVDFPETEALLLCEHFFSIDGRVALTLRGDNIPDEQTAERFLQAVEQRRTRPLQYILGEWEFCGMRLAVGEGVLVPREDTMALVELAAEGLRGVEKPRVLDLCAGTGAVALGMSRLLPDAQFVCVELSENAMPYLRRNIERFGEGRVSAVKADVLRPDEAAQLFESGSFDAIVSNPPYIRTDDMAGLSREVKQEPSMALDGGADGLEFYRVIASQWTRFLRREGVLAVELGYDQLEEVKRIFVRSGLSKIASKADFSGVQRAIIGTNSY